MLLMISLLLVACGPKTDTTTDKKEDTKTAESTETTDTEKTDDKDADCCDDATLNGVSEENPLKVDKDAKSVTIYTKYNGKFETEATRHLVICKDGKLSDKSIFSSYVSPTDFYNALVEVGAEAGNNMTADNAATTKTEGSKLLT